MLVYVPLLFDVELVHNHEFPGLPNKGHDVVTVRLQTKNLSADHSGICFACLFVAGHYLRARFIPPGLEFHHTIVTASTIFPVFEYPDTQSARSPPSATTS